jgi:hypothetical protein
MTKPCRVCREPITLRQHRDGQWIAFDSDPVVLKVEGNPIGGGTLEMIDAADRHDCMRPA